MYTQNYIFNKGKYFNLYYLVFNTLNYLTMVLFIVMHYNKWYMIGPKIQAARQEAKVAVAEYHERHGITGHH